VRHQPTLTPARFVILERDVRRVSGESTACRDLFRAVRVYCGAETLAQCEPPPTRPGAIPS